MVVFFLYLDMSDSGWDDTNDAQRTNCVLPEECWFGVGVSWDGATVDNFRAGCRASGLYVAKREAVRGSNAVMKGSKE